MKKYKHYRNRFFSALTALALAILTAAACALPAGATEGFAFNWDSDNNTDGPHCKSILMLNLDTNTVVYSHNPDERLPMASMTKIMSYIVAYETIPDIENTVITVPQSVVDDLEGTGSSLADVMVGEQLTGLQLLWMMMVPSGNDAALTLAEYVDGLYAAGQLPPLEAAPTADATQPESAGGDASGAAQTAADGDGLEFLPLADEGDWEDGGDDGYEDAGWEDGGEDPAAGTAEPAADGTAPQNTASPDDFAGDAAGYTPDSYFVQLMNAKAQELGCRNTHFTNPHGLHNPEHYSTARDMLTIAEYAMTLPNFTEITGSAAYVKPVTNMSDEEVTFTNTNKLLLNYPDEYGNDYYYQSATGIKTGSHDQAGWCVTASCTAYGYTYVVAALGDMQGYEEGIHREMLDVRSLFRWAVTSLEKKTVAVQGDILSSVDLEYAFQKDQLLLAAGEAASVMLPSSVDSSSIQVTVNKPESVQAPVRKGEQVGTATLSYADEVIATVPLVAAESVARSDLIAGWEQGKSLLFSPWFLVVLFLILALIIVYLILVVMYRRKQRMLRRVRKFRDM